jgi:hypothetical protein
VERIIIIHREEEMIQSLLLLSPFIFLLLGSAPVHSFTPTIGVSHRRHDAVFSRSSSSVVFQSRDDKTALSLEETIQVALATQKQESGLPIFDILDGICDSLSTVANTPNLLVEAPPGAGKTTIVPLALLLLKQNACNRILVVEPRRAAWPHARRRRAWHPCCTNNQEGPSDMPCEEMFVRQEIPW